MDFVEFSKGTEFAGEAEVESLGEVFPLWVRFLKAC